MYLGREFLCATCKYYNTVPSYGDQGAPGESAGKCSLLGLSVALAMRGRASSATWQGSASADACRVHLLIFYQYNFIPCAEGHMHEWHVCTM